MSSFNVLSLRCIPRPDNNINNNIVEEYTNIPEQFIAITDWPKKCNHSCYTCTEMIKFIPLFIPSISESDVLHRSNKLLFCSPSCVFKHISKLDSNRDLYMQMTRKLIQKISGIPSHRQIAELTDDRSVMNMYGGNMTKREYQDTIYNKNKEYFDIIKTLI